MYLSLCGRRQLELGAGPYFYLPKMESHLEARLWTTSSATRGFAGFGARDVGRRCSSRRCRQRSKWTRSSSSCATTPPAERGPMDYLFSIIKKLRNLARVRCPDRNSVTMAHAHAGLFKSARADLPRRGAHAIEAWRPSSEPSGPGRQPACLARCERTKSARRGRFRRLLGGPPGPCALMPGGVRFGPGRAPQPA